MAVSNIIYCLLNTYESSTVKQLVTLCFAAGNKVGVSLLIEDGALPWIVKNANHDASPIRRHIELALCHLAQHGNFT